MSRCPPARACCWRAARWTRRGCLRRPRSGWAPTTDQLASGREAASRRWPGRLAAVVALLLLAGWLLDGQLRDRELSRLLVRIASAQSTATYADNRVAATTQYVSPLLTSARQPPSVRHGLERLVEQEAAEQVPDVQRSVAATDIAVLPWHHALGTARDRYRSYGAHRLAVLRAGATDLRALGAPHPELDEELAAVRSALLRAGASRRQVDAALR